MRLEPLYRARFSTPERWSVQLDGAHGTETQSLLFAQGCCEGQVTGSLRAANFPRLRTDDTLTPDFRRVIETNDGAAILFTCHGYVRTAPDGVRQLVGAMTHISDHERYRWLNNVICPVTGVVEPRANGHSSEVALEISQLIWEPASA
ncbi:MAG TPA: DUF3237 family protein [Solirubrobacteraceae bacterium]|jgi:hypothetical protein|nr:DUF3237 family protein [Solirubrobacteraceae bacterium]